MKTFLHNHNESAAVRSLQFATFFVDGRLYGIDVCKVQEVTRPLQITKMRTAPSFIKGLINLRGQIATAIGLRELFQLSAEQETEKMTVVCKVDDVLISLLVDSIGDVVEVATTSFEPAPLTVPLHIRHFMGGVYKTEHSILSVLNLESIVSELDKKCA